KNWKFSLGDVQERRYWDAYMAAYEDMVRHTSSAHAPWYVVPADHKWFTRLVVVSAILDALSSLGLAFPTVEPDRLQELQAARAPRSGGRAGLARGGGGGARRRRSFYASRGRRVRPGAHRESGPRTPRRSPGTPRRDRHARRRPSPPSTGRRAGHRGRPVSA